MCQVGGTIILEIDISHLQIYHTLFAVIKINETNFPIE